MSDFCTASLSSTASATYKRVRYTTGLVLGVDEFEQDQAYLMERDRLHQRALHGYGTVHGLRVEVVDADATGDVAPEVRVAPGLAVDPHGQHICVPETQCARLDDWLAQQDPADTGMDFGSPPTGRVSVYVVLRYRACPTDAVPLPGEPCRSLDDTMAASRMADDFALDLTFERPPHVEERLLRLFGDLLNAVQVAEAAPTVQRDELLMLVRALPDLPPGSTLDDLLALLPAGSPPDASPPETSPPDGSPPLADGLTILPEQASDIFRDMGRVWATEVRPRVLRTGRENDPLNASYREEGAGRCSSVPAGDDGVLLAEVDVEVEATSTGLRRLPGDLAAINVIERDRPVLLTTRLLQEGPGAFPGTGGSGESSGPGPIELDDLTDVVIPASAPLTNRVLGWDAAEGRWEPVDLPSPTTDHGSMSGLEDDDHPQYLLVDPNGRSLVDELNAGNFRLTNLAPSAAPGDAVRRDEVVRDGDAASRDLDGTYPDPIVVGLRERPLSTTPPSDGQVLQWSEDPQSGTGEWIPATVASGGSSSREETDLTRIVALNYVHGQPSSLRFNFEGNNVNGIAIAFGLAAEGDNLVPGPVQRSTLTDRTVQVFTEEFDTNALGGRGAWRRLRLDFDQVIPLTDVSLNNGLVVAGVESNDALVDGVFLPMGDSFLEQIPNGLLEIAVRGDFILDAQNPPRAIDAEHARGQRPTGDRPQGADAGVQGGLFESWVQYQMGVVNLNTATAEELRDLSGVGPELADRIVEERDRQGGFADVDALNEVRGIGRSLLTRLRGRVSTDPIDPVDPIDPIEPIDPRQ